MDENILNESSFRRARHDFASAYHKILFFVVVEIIMMGVGAFIGSLIVPDQPSGIITAGYPVAGAIIGALISMAIIFIVCLFRAPYNQRNELRTAIGLMQGTKDIPILPASVLYTEAQEFEFGKSGVGGFPISEDSTIIWLRVLSSFEAQFSMLVESVELRILEEHIPADNWESDHTPLLKGYLYFALSQKIAPGQHDAQMVAFAEGKWWGSKTFKVIVPDR